MVKFTTLSILIILVAIVSCQKKSSEPVVVEAPYVFNPIAIADKIIERSIPQPGEQVLLIALPGEFDSLVSLLSERISKSGGVYLGTISVDTATFPEGWGSDFTKAAYGKSKEELTNLFKDVDLGIMLPGANPTHAPYAGLQEHLRQGKGRTIHFHWTGASDFSGSPVAIDSNVSKVYQKAFLETDYKRLSNIQKEFENALRKDWITVTTPAGTNLKFKIGDRPVTKQDGDASMARTQMARNLIDREVELPAGVIRVAPLEESVEGAIVLPDATWGDQKVEGLVLTFKNGKVTEINAKAGGDAVKNVLDQAGDAGHSFRELAVGFNPLLAIPNDKTWIPYYGYGAGVVRLSLGDNEELGGKVTGGWARMNLFTDATVIAGGETWVKDGKLVK